ncbi:hypothetical protein FBU30_006409 [Linnemannia zychae]|nr:hypothetical protein FBU30_006409 [Linnemannia zychae]
MTRRHIKAILAATGFQDFQDSAFTKTRLRLSGYQDPFLSGPKASRPHQDFPRPRPLGSSLRSQDLFPSAGYKSGFTMPTKPKNQQQQQQSNLTSSQNKNAGQQKASAQAQSTQDSQQQQQQSSFIQDRAKANKQHHGSSKKTSGSHPLKIDSQQQSHH